MEGQGRAESGLQATCLMPPNVKLEVYFLVLSLYRAEHLPRYDDRYKGQEIDAYVRVAFNGFAVRTKIIRNTSPRWGEEFWLVSHLLLEPLWTANLLYS